MIEEGMKPLVVTTSHKGVFFGYAKSELFQDGCVTLVDAQMCVYWPSETHGVLGLASGKKFPPGTRIGPVVPLLHLNNVDAVIEATGAAVAAWRAEPWS